MLDLKLDTFLTLCETRNYTKTANLLNITQPAVTQHIKHLESYYQTKLLYYDEKRRLHLTEHGKLLRAYAQTVKADSLIIERKLKMPIDQPDELRLGTLTTTGESLVPHMVAEYLKQYPDKKVSMYLGEADALLQQLKTGRIQFCIIDTYCPPHEFESYELFEADTICICSPEHPLAGKTVDFKELNDYRLIFRENDTNSHRNLMQILHTHNQDINNFRSYVEIGTINSVQKMVMENIGISFIYHFVAQKNLDNGTLSQIHIRNFSSHAMFNFVWLKDSFFEPVNRQFLDVCKEVLDSSYFPG
ncbi:MAG: LysR family transcriptional regulator [Faecalicatena sp.]|uniref:LysR family transcriptional regulator n=1 Tax=Faecalicatena sp. TaxID=2005360 RepID=UPI002590CDE4|nr:LysR family transcriptional regulator [Faecalicatena sp.]MCI6466543.1 LysR family transcriptional regulator [Faecalicatena sp.]MDY5617918.1 LysR family transcriptional regulator [Lachnospiraceae bacterium]